MTTEEILQECKDEIAMKYSCVNWLGVLLNSGKNGVPHESVIREESYFLYAQKIAELFSEWIRTFDVLQVDPSNREWFVESQISDEQLYQLFISQLNSTK